ncbi:MAG TPA: hypothetical protein VFA12_20455 [Stellaceae bacterium]|nr:hypothetical protein [Stellaceae bacterium]
MIDDLTPAERRAVALVGLMIRMHGGEGLFGGARRYGVLEARLRLAAERSHTVRRCWDLSARTMQWTIGPSQWDDAVLALIAPQDDDPEVLRALAERSQSCVMIARHLARRGRIATAASASAGQTVPLADPIDVFDLAEPIVAASDPMGEAA